MDWVLASASPRRRELLAELVDSFTIIPSNAEEIVEGNPTPAELVKALAKLKATEVASREECAGKIVIGADTVVALDGKILGKPKDEAEATAMLKALSGRCHEVYTGVCFIYPTAMGKNVKVAADGTKVYFATLSEEQIAAYVASGSPMDKAGAYGIQDGDLVERIEGSFSNVVGLPLELCGKIIEEIKTEML